MQTISPFQQSSHILYRIFGQKSDIWTTDLFFSQVSIYYDILKEEKCLPKYIMR